MRFCVNVFLQEELAFTFQLLQQHEEALVQYDELDALFSQFIINTHAGGTVCLIIIRSNIVHVLF